ncbi:MAG: hypothetical protein MI723_10495, partial [Caulobacterales bacterium]|nr:hypothetical protein [Caulobacterales bacterium]
MTMVRLLALMTALALALGSPAMAGGGGGAKKKVTGADSYLALPSLSASVVEDFQVQAILQVEAGLDISDGRKRA